jgi:RNA polymerase sigma factor (sigma-70 family)
MPFVRTLDALQALVPLEDAGSDAELLERYASGRSGAAFAELMRRHGPMVYGACKRIAHNGPDADDAFQATFLVLARAAHTIRSPGALRSWLHGVAVKVARKAQQQAIKRRVRQMAAARPEVVPPAQPMADWWAVVDEELRRLPEVLHQVILVCDLGGQSRSQASRELGWPEGTVAKRLARARQELAKGLARRGVTLTGAALSAALAAEATAAVPGRLRAETLNLVLTEDGGAGVTSVAVRTLVEGVMHSLKARVVRIWVITGSMALLLTGAGILLAGGLTETPQEQPGPARGTGDAKAERRVWKEVAVLDAPGWLPGSVMYASDGKTLVVGGSGGRVVAFDAATHRPKWKAEVGSNFAAVAFTADGKSVLATFRDGVRLLDAETGKLGKALEELGARADWRVLAVGVFPDRTIDSGMQKLTRHKIIFGTPLGYVVKEWVDSAEPGTITVSTVAKGKGPADPTAVPLAVDPAGTSAIITGPVHRDTGKNVLWAYVAGNHDKDSPGNRLLDGHQATVVSAAWSKDGKTAVTGDAGGRVLVWDAKTMRERQRLEFGQRVAALAVTADGRQIAAAVVGQRAEFYVWETAKAADKLRPLHVDAADYAGPIHAGLAFSPDGRRLAGTAYNAAWLNRLGRLVGRVHVWERAGMPAVKADPVPEDNPVPKAVKDEHLIQGNWRVTKVEMGGSPRTTRPGANEQWVVAKGRIQWSGVPRPVTLSYAIDPAKRPRQIDLEIVEGFGTGGRFQGIYRLGKDTLSVCYCLEGKERPTTFAGTDSWGGLLPGNPVLLVLKRLPVEEAGRP